MKHLLAVAMMFALACAASSSGDDVPQTIDAPSSTPIDAPGTTIDAPGNPPVDAPPATTAGLGAACTGTGQGSCPTGFECLNLTGGSGSWCSKRCTDINDQSCAAGYNGPGQPACILNVTPAGGGPAVPYCALLCFDAPGAPTYCPVATACNGTCPTPLACTADIGSPAQARLCQ